MLIGKVEIPEPELSEFCRKWQIKELSVFGSVLRDDFGPDSDIDVLYVLEDGARLGWEIVDAEAELVALLRRDVDLLSRRSVEHSPNWIRRNSILTSAKVIYGS